MAATRPFLSTLWHILVIGLLLAAIPPAQAAPIPEAGLAAPTLPVVTLEMNQPSASMGYSVAAAGDVNGDGYVDIIVGAPNYDLGQPNEGAAFVYHGSAGNLSTTPAAALQSNQAGALLGWSVAGAGDLNGDGYDDVIAGASRYDNGQADEGAVFVFYGSEDGVNTTPAAILESNQAEAYLGYSVARAGDVNGDGFADIIAGANWYDNGQADEGAIFVYHGSDSGLITTPVKIIEGNQAGAYLGTSLAGAGDVNHDGFDDIIAGIYRYYSQRGAALIYHGSADGLGSTYTTRLEGSSAGAWLGYSVSGAGDVNDDGFADVIVGAPLYDNTEVDEGAVFVYHGSAGGVSTTPAATLESNLADARLGWSVGGAGSVNGDRYADVIAGAYFFKNGTLAEEGAAYIFFSPLVGSQAAATTIMDSNQASAHLGWSVAGAGDINKDRCAEIITGAPGYNNGQENEGVAFVYFNPGCPNWIYLPSIFRHAP